MVRSLQLCLILLHTIIALTTANKTPPSAISPAPSPSVPKLPTARTLGKHKPIQQSFVAPVPSPSPSQAPDQHEAASLASEYTTSEANNEQDKPVVNLVHKGHHHSSIDKDIAGGGVILGGLATTFLVAIACYIKATGKKRATDSDPLDSKV